MLISASASNPPQAPKESFNERWNGADHGLIFCWQTGRNLAATRLDLRDAALAGQLPDLGTWKGGVAAPKEEETDRQAAARQRRRKIGALEYLATWQGLRGEDLSIDDEAEVTMRCARWGVTVTFTSDIRRLGQEES